MALKRGFAKYLGKIALALVFAAAGGMLFSYLTLPLPWMLGPIVFITAGAVAGLPMESPARVRRAVSLVIGLMLGSSFSPDIGAQIANWLTSLAMLTVYLGVSALIVIPYYRRVGGFDTTTAYFAGMPGGLTEMTFVGRDMGADDRSVVLAHASRVVVVVLIVAVAVRFLPDYDPGMRQAAGMAWSEVPLQPLLLLLAGGVAGMLIAKRLKLPAYHILGPTLASAVMHLTGFVDIPPPRELVIVSQLILGTIVGCRFIGMPPVQIVRSLLLGVGATVAMLLITLSFAILLHNLVGQSIVEVLLAYSPGGLAEMSLVALSLNEDVAFVAVHHLARVSIILAVAPVLFRLFEKRFRW